MPCFLGEPEQRSPQEQSGGDKENGRTIGMMQPKELTCKKYRKQQRRAHSAAQRQYDAVTQQACAARERTKSDAASNRSAVLIWECSGRFDAFADGREPRHHQGHESSNSTKKERGCDGI